MSNGIARAGYVLAGSVLAAMLALLLTNEFTKERIEESQQRIKSESLQSVLPLGTFDNAPLDKAHIIQARMLSSHGPVDVYPIYKDGRPFAAAITLTAADGYNGFIKLLLGVNVDGTIIGSRVIEHQETPGLGDDIEIQKSLWIDSFVGKSLSSAPSSSWNVKKEGGDFDGFTGATITPRAVIHAIHRALLWFKDHPTQVFIHEQ